MDRTALVAKKIELFHNIGEIGVSNTAASFSRLLECDVEVRNINSSMLRVSTLAEETGDPDNAAVGVYARVSGEASGHVAFLLPYDGALTLVDAVMKMPIGTRKRLDELSTLALQEIAKTVVSAQLSALSRVTGKAFSAGPISMAVDMAYRIVSSMLGGIGSTDPEAMVVACRFQLRDWNLDGLFLFVPDAGVTQKLLQAREARIPAI